MAVVLVTGGSRGIGLAIVRRLATAGDRVFSASRHPENAPAIDGVDLLALDVADPDAAVPAVAAVIRAAGRLDAVVNNAGAGVLAPLEETGDDDASAVFETNFFGPLRLARAALPVFRAQGGGRIVNVTSMNGVLPAPFGGYYSASKAALESASAALDAEVRPFGIGVSVVAPGLFRTDMAAAMKDAAIDPSSPYRARFEGMVAAMPARLETAADPDGVAEVVERCLRAVDPPARAVAGEDALAMEKLVRSSDPEQVATMLRDYVDGLAG